MDSRFHRSSHLRLVLGGAESTPTAAPRAPSSEATRTPLSDRFPPIPRWQLCLAVVSKIVLLGSLYYLIRS